jgi:cell division protein FtsB
MANFNKKNKYSFWHSPIVLLVLFCLVVLFAYNMVGLIRKERDTAKKKELMLDQIDTLNKRQEVLSKDIDKLNSPEGIEDTIREKYQVVKPQEKMVIIVDDQQKPLQGDDPARDHSFWGFIKRMFGKK